MRPDSSKNQDLIKQYPFVSAILNGWMEPYSSWEATTDDAKRIDDLTIKVEKADGDLMFRRARNIGLGDSSYGWQVKGNRKGQIMRRGEYAFAINKNGEIIKRLNFPRNGAKQGAETYAWWMLWRSRKPNVAGSGYVHSGSLAQETQYIVWATIEAWFADTKIDDAPGSRFGAFHDRTAHITIYKEPDEGFKKLQENANVYQNLWLDTHVMTHGEVNRDRDIIVIGGMLYEMCITFQDEVYFNGMKEIVDGGKYRGASGQFGPVKVLVAEACGYDRVMLEDSVSYVTFQLRPGSEHMYVLGQQGTLPQIRNLVRTVVRMWNQKPELRGAFKPDENVTVM